jgi:hypothetical protein
MSQFEDNIKQEADSALRREEQQLNKKGGLGQDERSEPQTTADAQPQHQADAPTPDTNS